MCPAVLFSHREGVMGVAACGRSYLVGMLAHPDIPVGLFKNRVVGLARCLGQPLDAVSE